MSDPLWAPWRMDYILGNKPSTCIFCAFHVAEAAQKRADLVLWKQNDAFVCLNRYPFAAGHLLVVPAQHVAGLHDLNEAEYASFMRLVRASAKALSEAIRPQGLNVGFNLGKSAGAGIAEHLHGHIVPRWEGDTNFMPVLADTRVMPEHLDATYERLLPHFRDLGEHVE